MKEGEKVISSKYRVKEFDSRNYQLEGCDEVIGTQHWEEAINNFLRNLSDRFIEIRYSTCFNREQIVKSALVVFECPLIDEADIPF